MTTETIKEFLVGLGFKVDEESLGKFNQGIFKAGVGVTALGNLLSDAVQDIAKGIAEVLNVNRYAEQLDKIDELSQRTKVAADEILRLGYQAQISGSSFEALESSLDGLSKTAGLASIGMGRGVKVFQEIGVEVNDSNGKLKDTTVLMGEIGAKIKDMEVGKQTAILGRLGLDPSLLHMMTEDMSELNAEYAELVKQSGFSAKQATEDAAEYMDALDKLRFAVSFIGKSVSAKLFKSMSESADRLRRLIVDNMPKIIAAIESVIRVVLYLANIFATVGARIFNIIAGVIEWLGKVNDATDGWLLKIGLLIAAWRAFNLSILLTPIGMLLALAAAIALLIEDFYVFKEGGESLIDWSKWEPGFNAVMAALYEMKDILSAFFTFIFAGVDFLISLLTGDFAGAWFAIKEVVMSVISAISHAFGLIASVGEAIGNFAGAIMSPGSMLTPSPAAAAGLNGMNQSVTQETNIVVQGGDPVATGKAVAGQQDRVNADMTRNMGTRAR